MTRLLLALVAVTVLAVFVEGRQYSSGDASSMEDYLRGSWLVRPADLFKGGFVSAANYTHIVHLNSSIEDESVLTGTVDPFEMPSPPWLVQMFLQTYFAVEQVVLPLLGRPPRKVDVAAAVPEPPLFRSFDVTVLPENYISGSVVVDQRSMASCPGPRHLNLTYVAHYSSTEGQASTLRIASGAVHTDGAFSLEDAEGTEACAPWPRRIATYTFLVVDDSNIQIMLESAPNPYTSVLPAKTQLHTFHLRRREAPSGDALTNSFGTLVLLGIVALVKFGPRAYLKWKGINPNDFMGGRKQNQQTLTIEQRVELVKKQRAVMEEMRVKKLI